MTAQSGQQVCRTSAVGAWAGTLLLLVVWAASASAQAPVYTPDQIGGVLDDGGSFHLPGLAPTPPERAYGGCGCTPGTSCQDCSLTWSSPVEHARIYGGADYLVVRPHFSEAVAFAVGSQTPSSFRTESQPLEFDYESSMRSFAAYRMQGLGSDLRFTFWHLHGDVTENGTVGGPGQFLIDPFGNLAGAVVVVDPRDARFGSVLVGGQAIRARASVDANVYDLDLVKRLALANPCWDLSWSLGARVVDINQFYESRVTDAADAVVSQGEFDTEFIGAGPRFGLESRCYLGGQKRLSLFASCHGALALGQYDVRFENAPAPGFEASQQQSLTRTIVISDAELGASWQLCDSLSVSLGWLLQGWFDLGASGGTFSGFFAGADDANIMSFDGMVARAQLCY